MNRLALLNKFKRGLGDLLAAVEREVSRPERDPFAETDPSRRPHEHDTRVLFVDELLGLLGWRLGAEGNVLEEARLGADTTTFMDYVGVVEIDNSPLLLVEAKAWNKPRVSVRRKGQDASLTKQIVSAIGNIRDGKGAGTSPLIAEWHGYLHQVHGYVQTLKEGYGHLLPKAVIISGEWMVVFTKPVETFLGAAQPDDILIFERTQFGEKADEIFDLLHRSALTMDAPIPLRPAQLRQFVELDGVAGAFNGVHVRYERTGSSLFSPRPRILIYPALFVVRNDDAVFTVMDGESCMLDYLKDDDGIETLTPHLADIRERMTALIEACEVELRGRLPIAELSAFPGFPIGRMEKGPVRNLRVADEWLVATGSATHFLLAEPRVERCGFHSWVNCGAHAVAQSAVMARCLEPPVFFTDAQRHHCAHQVVHDRREARCLIQGIDSRICCQACVFLEHCWTAEERAGLPCGT